MAIKYKKLGIKCHEDLRLYIESENKKIRLYNQGKPKEEQKTLLNANNLFRHYETYNRREDVKRFRRQHHCYDCDRYGKNGTCSGREMYLTELFLKVSSIKSMSVDMRKMVHWIRISLPLS